MMIKVRNNKLKSKNNMDELSDITMIFLKQKAHSAFLKHLHKGLIKEYTTIDKLYCTDSVGSLKYIIHQHHLMTNYNSDEQPSSRSILATESALARYLNEIGNLAVMFSKVEGFNETSKLHRTIDEFLSAVAFDTMILNTFYNRDYPKSVEGIYSQRGIG